jgi:hypothetical protein
LYGHNPRVNQNSTDNSTNIAYISGDLFVQMNEKASSINDENARKEILARLDELERTQGSGGVLRAYQNFITSAAKKRCSEAQCAWALFLLESKG